MSWEEILLVWAIGGYLLWVGWSLYRHKRGKDLHKSEHKKKRPTR